MSIAEGIQRSIAAIRAAAPEMRVVHVEATHVWTTADASLEDERRLLDEKNWLPTDLALGRVDGAHAMHAWLLEHGITVSRLDGLVSNAQVPDQIGVNFYPELSARELTRIDGAVVGVAFDSGRAGLEGIVRGFHDRYALPVLVSETAVEGDDDHRVRWLDDAVALIAELREEGIPVVGLVWWPLFDFVDWSWATGDLVIEEFYVRVEGVVTPVIPPPRGAGIDAYFRRMGLFRLAEVDGDIARQRTPAADSFTRYSAASPSSALDALRRTE